MTDTLWLTRASAMHRSSILGHNDHGHINDYDRATTPVLILLNDDIRRCLCSLSTVMPWVTNRRGAVVFLSSLNRVTPERFILLDSYRPTRTTEPTQPTGLTEQNDELVNEVVHWLYKDTLVAMSESDRMFLEEHGGCRQPLNELNEWVQPAWVVLHEASKYESCPRKILQMVECKEWLCLNQPLRWDQVPVESRILIFEAVFLYQSRQLGGSIEGYMEWDVEQWKCSLAEFLP